jgi:hypothetical protein
VASFPALKSGAVAQYPSDRSSRFSTHVCRFLGGAEQRFPLFGASLKRWRVQLELLDEAELARVEAFFLSEGGRAASFSFVDPWDGMEYPDCSFADDVLGAEYRGIADGAGSFVIQENR